MLVCVCINETADPLCGPQFLLIWRAQHKGRPNLAECPAHWIPLLCSFRFRDRVMVRWRTWSKSSFRHILLCLVLSSVWFAPAFTPFLHNDPLFLHFLAKRKWRVSKQRSKNEFYGKCNMTNPLISAYQLPEKFQNGNSFFSVRSGSPEMRILLYFPFL